jgi:hypothetical protein
VAEPFNKPLIYLTSWYTYNKGKRRHSGICVKFRFNSAKHLYIFSLLHILAETLMKAPVCLSICIIEALAVGYTNENVGVSFNLMMETVNYNAFKLLMGVI